jgi:steroid 5-alpha reductase family enzyme
MRAKWPYRDWSRVPALRMISPTMLAILLQNAALSAACFVGLWLISLAIRDVSFIDSWWALGIVVLALATHVETGDHRPRGLLILALTAVWGLRLGLYLFRRWRTQGPDPRYSAIMKSAAARRGWSFAKTAGLQVFLLQGVLQFIVAMPVMLGQMDDAGVPGARAFAGAALAFFGIFFESIGDWQLARFRKDLANKGRVMDTGLWRTTRHPNYFGDTCVWWGLYLIAAETKFGVWAFPAPILVTVLLTRVSGMPLLEHQLRKNRPGYADYVARTSGFIPWWPKRS